MRRFAQKTTHVFNRCEIEYSRYPWPRVPYVLNAIIRDLYTRADTEKETEGAYWTLGLREAS